MRIDLNADLGEGFGAYTIGDDAALLDIVTSANVACGFHAGDPAIMVATAKAAKARRVSLGAHPGFQDLRGFGRRVIAESASEIEAGVAYQIGALQSCAALAGHRVTYVKAHGALANLSNAEPAVAKALADAVRGVDRALALVVMPGLAAELAAGRAGLRAVKEVYADRAYADDGQLCARSLPGAVLTDPATAGERVRRMVEDGTIVTLSGRRIAVAIETVCVHGDSPGAVAMARIVRQTLETTGCIVAPFGGPTGDRPITEASE